MRQAVANERSFRQGARLWRIPVTILTGFLGAGKTTLLNRILTEQHSGAGILATPDSIGAERAFS